MENRFISVLVAGNPDNVKLYDGDYNSDTPIIKMRYDDVHKEKNKLISSLMYVRNRLKESGIFEYTQIDTALTKLGEMSEMGFLVNFNPDCEFDENCNAIYKKKDLPVYYSHAVCYNDRLKFLSEEAPMTTPFKLLDGRVAYIASKGYIDWEYMHGRNKELYGRVWDMCVNGSEPEDENEIVIFESMKDRKKYFSNFSSKEDYVMVSTNFWCHAFIHEDGKIDYIDHEKSHEWASEFYDRFLKNLDGGVQLALFEAKFEK